MIRKILIANRGEIAVRIIKTCQAMGIATVAVYSDADKYSLAVEMADEAFHIGASEPSESYLNIEKIILAATVTGADAIHPGFGRKRRLRPASRRQQPHIYWTPRLRY
jgi:acetyl/propionyl-CoA carboxylase alpha subunit